jgi:hypothetical protein
MIGLRKKYNEQTYTLLQYMMPEYEKYCLKEYVPNEESLIFYNTKDSVVTEIQGKLKEFGGRHQFDQLLQSFRI